MSAAALARRSPRNDPSAFATAGADLWRRDLLPIPVGGSDGKKPLIRGFTEMPRPSLATVEAWAQRFQGAGIGIVTGAGSGVVVVDTDTGDPHVFAAVERRFGRTPLRIRTPSGQHWYYEDNGERCRNLRPELPVDIKAGGGFVVVPPTFRSSGKGYTFAPGSSWDDLAHLPAIKPGALERVREQVEPARLQAIGVGRRNKTLFRTLMKHAPHCDDFAALLDKAFTINSDCYPPLPGAEVEKIARSAWSYQEQGKNWTGTEAHAVTTEAEFQALIIHPGGTDAFVLLTKFKLAHGARTNPFAAVPHAMAKARVIPAWGGTHQKYRDAIELLVDVGGLELVHRGGSRRGDPSLYKLTAIERSTRSKPLRVIDAT